MTDALVHSMNTIAAYISTEMGKEQFYSYLQRFGFGSMTHVDLAGEVVGMMKLPGEPHWSRAELATNSFGQGIAVTPIQMITAVAAVANDGVLMKPYVVKEIIAPTGTGRTKTHEVLPQTIRPAIKPETAAVLTQMLVQVVEREVTEARIPGYRVAGKTGTAEIPTPTGYEKENTITSFVGYAPADDPQFVVLVKLDRPKTSQWAGHTAAPAFQAVTQRILRYRHVPPDEIRLAQN
jgi:cell division protein FtsI/penicillin-binding protein 2